MHNRSTVNPLEIQQFDRLASQWWDEKGPFRPLHRLNPMRLAYLKGQIAAHYNLNLSQTKILSGLSVLDIGCGGGLIAEPLTRMGANVTGLDGGAENIEAARLHAAQQNLQIQYHAKLAEQWVETKQQYDVVLALEIIEHVDDPAFFVAQCLELTKPGGLIVFSTLNRTPKSYALGIVAAEYLLRWVPQGTHDWKKFVKPSELAHWLRDAKGCVKDMCGLTYNPVLQKFSLSPHDVSVNYFLTAVKE